MSIGYGPIRADKGDITGIHTFFQNQTIRIIFLVVFLILGIIIVSKIIRAVKRPPNAKYIPGGGELPAGWDPKEITVELFDVIDGGFTMPVTKEAAFKRFNDLNDNQMIAVYNKWIKDGYDKKGTGSAHGSLYKAVKNEIGYPTFGGNQKDIMEANMIRLKLE